MLTLTAKCLSTVLASGWLGEWSMLLGTWSVAIALLLLCAAAWCLNFIALPGNWIAVAVIAVYAWLGPDQGRPAIGGGLVAIAFVVAMVGEAAEFVAGAMGASRAGASRRATLYAMGGSMIGAITGGLVGLPVPVLGPILAAVLFGGLGATAGAMYAESTDGKPWRESWSIGRGAFIGRTLGTVGKSMIGLAIVVLVLIGICL